MQNNQENYQIISLPTKQSKLVKMNGKRCYSFSEKPVSYFNFKNAKTHDLFVISREKLKTDSYVLFYDEGVIMIGFYPSSNKLKQLKRKYSKESNYTFDYDPIKVNILENTYYLKNNYNIGKYNYIGIIKASTNSMLIDDDVPMIHDNFIKMYSDNNGAIEHVEKSTTINGNYMIYDYQPTDYNNSIYNSLAWLYERFSDPQLNSMANFYYNKEHWEILTTEEKIEIYNIEIGKNHKLIDALDWWYSLDETKKFNLSDKYLKDWLFLSEKQIMDIYDKHIKG